MNVSIAPRYQPKDVILFSFEDNFDFYKAKQFANEHWYEIFLCCPLYVILIFGLQAFMKNRKPLNLRGPLIVWNICFTIFSTLGFLRTFPECMYVLYEFGFQYSVCVPTFLTHNKVSAFWTVAFGWSKLVEFGDTLFVILRKQKLIFLHWYHHAVVALVCTIFSYDYPALIRWGVWINYAVHAMMYSYYALRAMRIKTSKWHAMSITCLQITQMVVVFTVAVYAFKYIAQGVECNLRTDLLFLTATLYASLFVLFFNFFVKTYMSSSKKTSLVSTDVKKVD